MADEQSYKLKKLLNELASLKGRHTELVSVYIPKDYPIHEIMNLIATEISLTQNVKSKAVRKNVIDALTKIQQHLKLYKKTPEHGLALFCGNVSEHEGGTDIKIWSVEPPEPVPIKLYWCDQKFELGPLMNMVAEKEIYGLVVMDLQECTIGLLKGKAIQVLRHMTSIVPGKTAKGGQCLAFDTLVFSENGLEKIEEIKVGSLVKSVLFDNNFSFKNSKVLDAWKTEKLALEIITENPELKIVSSKEHVFFSLENEKIIEKSAEEMKVGDFLLAQKNEKLSPVKIKKIVEKEKEINMIDISVADRNFFANGILVHNSAGRYERVREGLTNDWLKMVAENTRAYLDKPEIKGIILGGSGPLKNTLYEEGYFLTEVKKKIIGIQDTGSTDEHGLSELVERAGELLKEASVAKEKALMQKFLTELQKNSGLVVYGTAQVIRAVEAGAVDILLVSEKFSWPEFELICEAGHAEKRFCKPGAENSQECKECKKKMKVIGEKDPLDAIEELAKTFGTKIEIISADTGEGQKLEAIGGIGAILRYRFEG